MSEMKPWILPDGTVIQPTRAGYWLAGPLLDKWVPGTEETEFCEWYGNLGLAIQRKALELFEIHYGRDTPLEKASIGDTKTPAAESDVVCIRVLAPKGLKFMLATADRKEVNSVSQKEFLVQSEDGDGVFIYPRSRLAKNLLVRSRYFNEHQAPITYDSYAVLEGVKFLQIQLSCGVNITSVPLPGASS